VQAVVDEPLGRRERLALARRLSHDTLPCPARRLEFVCYARSAISPAARRPQFELNLNTGAGARDHLAVDPAEEPSHWFLLDIAAGRGLGIALLGPAPADVFAPIPRLWCLEALEESLAWHEQHEPASANTLLNACRGWRYAATGRFGSKQAGAAWALRQPACPAAVRQALKGPDGPLPSGVAVTELVELVSGVVRTAMRRERVDP
jgi:hypothetical protein